MVCLGDIFVAIPDFAAFGDEVVEGSITSSAVISFSKFRSAMFPPANGVQGA